MKEYIYKSGNFFFLRISKNKARAAYNNGLHVVFCPVNLKPGKPWYPESTEGIRINPEKTDFDTLVKEYEYYNCTNTETGRYTAFYVPVTYNGWYHKPRYNYDYEYLDIDSPKFEINYRR